MGTQTFCLKWNNHQSNMLNVFENLWSNETFVDVTLACEGASLRAHKIVLSACSPFFQSLLSENPCQHPIVILRDIKYQDLKSVIHFMYKGEVHVSQNNLSALLKTAELLKVKGLAEVLGEDQGGINRGAFLHTDALQHSVERSDSAQAIEAITTNEIPNAFVARKRGRPRKSALPSYRPFVNSEANLAHFQNTVTKNLEHKSAKEIDSKSLTNSEITNENSYTSETESIKSSPPIDSLKIRITREEVSTPHGSSAKKFMLTCHNSNLNEKKDSVPYVLPPELIKSENFSTNQSEEILTSPCAAIAGPSFVLDKAQDPVVKEDRAELLPKWNSIQTLRHRYQEMLASNFKKKPSQTTPPRHRFSLVEPSVDLSSGYGNKTHSRTVSDKVRSELASKLLASRKNKYKEGTMGLRPKPSCPKCHRVFYDKSTLNRHMVKTCFSESKAGPTSLSQLEVPSRNSFSLFSSNEIANVNHLE